MSRSHGSGSPLFFHCPVKRREMHDHYYRPHSCLPPRRHKITLTGRTKPYKAKMRNALGLRSTATAREWVCECGRTGWSNHVDLERLATTLSE